MATKQATAQQAEAVVDALMKAFDQRLFDWERPRVMVDSWAHGRTVFEWEEGPYGWMSVFPWGGSLNGTSFEVPEATLPEGVWVEPCDGCVVGVYQEVETFVDQLEQLDASRVSLAGPIALALGIAPASERVSQTIGAW